MEKILKYSYKIRRDYPEIDDDIKKILSDCRTPQSGMTLSEIRAAYKERTEESFPIKAGPIIQTEFLLTIPHIAGYCNENTTLFFYRVD